MIRYSVRIKLSDFIDTPQEEQILGAVFSISEDTGKKIFLKLWYNKDEISAERIADFLRKHSKLLEEIGTNIHIGEHESWTTKSWFNMRKRGVSTPNEYRHEYTYTTPYSILEGLLVFREMVKKTGELSINKPPPSDNGTQRDNGKTNNYKVSYRRISNIKE